MSPNFGSEVPQSAWAADLAVFYQVAGEVTPEALRVINGIVDTENMLLGHFNQQQRVALTPEAVGFWAFSNVSIVLLTLFKKHPSRSAEIFEIAGNSFNLIDDAISENRMKAAINYLDPKGHGPIGRLWNRIMLPDLFGAESLEEYAFQEYVLSLRHCGGESHIIQGMIDRLRNTCTLEGNAAAISALAAECFS